MQKETIKIGSLVTALRKYGEHSGKSISGKLIHYITVEGYEYGIERFGGKIAVTEDSIRPLSTEAVVKPSYTYNPAGRKDHS